MPCKSSTSRKSFWVTRFFTHHHHDFVEKWHKKWRNVRFTHPLLINIHPVVKSHTSKMSLKKSIFSIASIVLSGTSDKLLSTNHYIQNCCRINVKHTRRKKTTKISKNVHFLKLKNKFTGTSNPLISIMQVQRLS